MEFLLMMALVYGAVFFVIKYYDSKNVLVSSLSWVVGLIIIVCLFLTTKGRY